MLGQDCIKAHSGYGLMSMELYAPLICVPASLSTDVTYIAAFVKTSKLAFLQLTGSPWYLFHAM